MRNLYVVHADYPYQEDRTEIIRVMATGHEQHIWTHTRLLGVSKAGIARLEAFAKSHQDAEIRLGVPGGPLLDGWMAE